MSDMWSKLREHTENAKHVHNAQGITQMSLPYVGQIVSVQNGSKGIGFPVTIIAICEHGSYLIKNVAVVSTSMHMTSSEGPVYMAVFWHRHH